MSMNRMPKAEAGAGPSSDPESSRLILVESSTSTTIMADALAGLALARITTLATTAANPRRAFLLLFLLKCDKSLFNVPPRQLIPA